MFCEKFLNKYQSRKINFLVVITIEIIIYYSYSEGRLSAFGYADFTLFYDRNNFYKRL